MSNINEREVSNATTSFLKNIAKVCRNHSMGIQVDGTGYLIVTFDNDHPTIQSPTEVGIRKKQVDAFVGEATPYTIYNKSFGAVE